VAVLMYFLCRSCRVLRLCSGPWVCRSV